MDGIQRVKKNLSFHSVLLPTGMGGKLKNPRAVLYVGRDFFYFDFFFRTLYLVFGEAIF